MSDNYFQSLEAWESVYAYKHRENKAAKDSWLLNPLAYLMTVFHLSNSDICLETIKEVGLGTKFRDIFHWSNQITADAVSQLSLPLVFHQIWIKVTTKSQYLTEPQVTLCKLFVNEVYKQHIQLHNENISNPIF